ncbi:dTDP-glucose 4,6-dehydratase [Clostridium sp. ZS2-4]|uniref:dTDP-glucose 4,6-dehydratase n=1 Tax=Clostridium sp. ZS2-4 TaxID=2987703 RepID=UPI00227D550F|nr:dTDP-glucose 4,6-dehydratase [Clostridium sp. ZS2-4]MCY6356040.1 dTDP-glucose 4,6-dehydratase [Clostridium sp. ZS2-4]
MKTYLITGGAGFIGSNFILYMLKKYNDIKIINFDKLTYAGNLENLKEVESNTNYRFIQGDICDRDILIKLFEENDIDYVVNFAAESHVDRSIYNPNVFIKTNVLGTHNLINVTKEYWELKDKFIEEKKFLQISTDEVYGSLGQNGFFTEKSMLNPHSPYSASKASADLIVKSYYDTYKIPINITRCSNNYGPYQFPEKLIPLTINNCLNKKYIPIYGDGKNIRDWIYVEDHCRAIDLVLQKGKIGEVYNIGANNEKQNIQIVKTIIDILNDTLPDNDYRKKYINYKLIKYVNDRKGHDKRYAIDAGKIEKELNWRAKVSFKKGIKNTIEWYLKNEIWLKNITLGEYRNYYTKIYNQI